MTSPKLDEAAIFNVARQIVGPDAQRFYIDQVCGNDDKLRTRLTALLRIYKDDQTFLEQPAEGVPVATTDQVSEIPGRQIGPYKLLEVIGEGGFGKVFMAEQHQPVRRTVAVKVIKPGMDTGQVIARFESERQALALMSHPNIAQIIDGGETTSGRPYFVMELVRGVPITEFCDRNHSTMEERLKLFVSVCHAIQHAHHKGVIHRDIKPSNVMVTLNDGAPVVKIIDFGVAKATEQRLTEKTLFTSYGQMIGTPAYMSPEQASMSLFDVDTRSDIYSLGVLLYELLTGTTPIEAARLREAGYAEIQRLIRDVEPPRPSTRLSALGDSATVVAGNRATDSKHLFRLLAGDLDWIVMKALEKDRNRRYRSPASLAADVGRYLRREAILARPPSVVYRLAKFAERHRGAALAAVAVAAAILMGTTVATWQAVVATRAKHEALAAAAAETLAKQGAIAKEAETQAVLGFVQNQILAAARPKGRNGGLGPGVTLREAIDAAVPFVEKNFKDQPLTEARLRMTLGNSFWYLGDGKAAEAQYEPARVILTRLKGPHHRDTLQCLILLGISYGMQGRTQDSVSLYEEILPTCKSEFGPDSRETLQCLNNLAMGFWMLDKHEEAIQIHREALAIKKVKFGPDDRSTLITMTNLANGYHSLHRYEDALKLRLEALELYKSRYGPGDYDTLMVMHNVGSNLRALGHFVEALRLDQETRARRKETLGADHPDTLTSLWSVAQDLIKLDRGIEAVPILDECLQRSVGKRIHQNFPEVADYRLRYFEKARDAEGCRTTAELWEKQERTDAESLYQAAVCRAVTAAVLKQVSAPGSRAAGLSKDEADRAMTWLKKAVSAGYNDVTQIKTGKDLDTLRDRADFKELLAALGRSRRRKNNSSTPWVSVAGISHCKQSRLPIPRSPPGPGSRNCLRRGPSIPGEFSMSNYHKKRQGDDMRRAKRSRPWLEALEHRVVLSTFKVNTTLDTVAVSLKTGKDASGHISLRSAIMAADARPNADTIIVPAGTFTLTLAGAGENNDATGDLDITGNLTIKGKGASTIVNGNNLDRVFDVLGGKVSISKLTVEGGLAAGDGGGILNEAGARLTLNSVQVMNNVAAGTPGTNGVDGTGGNPATAGGVGGDALGGGIFNAGTLILNNCTLMGDQAKGGAGGKGGAGSGVLGVAGTAGGVGQAAQAANGADGGAGGSGSGGGIFNAAGASLTVAASTILNNSALGGAGGAGGAGGQAEGGMGGSGVIIGSSGAGGNGVGGNGANGGAGGLGSGGGLSNLGQATFSGKASTVASNNATGGIGGVGGNGRAGIGGVGGDGGSGPIGGTGGPGGNGTGGTAGRGGKGGDGDGGGIFVGAGTSFMSTVALTISTNTAVGNLGGAGGAGGEGIAGHGGAGGASSTNNAGSGGAGGTATGGVGGNGGIGGAGQGGGLFNAAAGTVAFQSQSRKGSKAAPESVITNNQANGGGGGAGGIGGAGGGGSGGNSGGSPGIGGSAGSVTAGAGGAGGAANEGLGGGLFNAGSASFTDDTVNFTTNQATGAIGGNGGNGGEASGETGGTGLPAGSNGNATGGNGGNAGDGGTGLGGGLFDATTGTLVINPRLGVKKNSKQNNATDIITGNKANAGGAGSPGAGGLAQVASGATATNGTAGTAASAGVGVGGGIVIVGTATIDNTTITGNTATTNDNDVDGTFST